MDNVQCVFIELYDVVSNFKQQEKLRMVCLVHTGFRAGWKVGSHTSEPCRGYGYGIPLLFFKLGTESFAHKRFRVSKGLSFDDWRYCIERCFSCKIFTRDTERSAIEADG